jgi:hypothetical protein
MGFLLSSYLFYYFGFLSNYNWYSAQKAIHKGQITIILWLDSSVSGRISKICSKYNVNTKRVEVNNLNWRGVEIYNKKMDQELKKKMGEIKYNKMERELDSLSQTWTISL